MMRMQITLDPRLRSRVKKQAERLGLPIAEYVRQAIEKDLGNEPARASVSELFDLGRSREPTDIAKHKDKMIGDAIAAAKLGK